MAKLNIFLLFLISLHYINLNKANSVTTTSDPNPEATEFIKAECRATHYPALCIHCLSSYSATIHQSHQRLSQAALSVSLSRAKSVAIFVSKVARMRGLKPIEYRAAKDCVENMANTIDQLGRSVKELGSMSGDFDWHVSNVEAWVSSALTFENTCLEGFRGSNMDGSTVKVAVRRRVLDCTQVTSNALGLINRFASRHRLGASSHVTKSP